MPLNRRRYVRIDLDAQRLRPVAGHEDRLREVQVEGVDVAVVVVLQCNTSRQVLTVVAVTCRPCSDLVEVPVVVMSLPRGDP